jgi:hypothetical protein
MAVAAVAGLAAAGGQALATGFALGTFLGTFALTAGLSAVSQRLQGRPTIPSFSDAGRNTYVRQAISSHQVVYGEVRQSGPLVYIESTDNDKYLHMVIALAPHEVEDISKVLVFDEELTLDANGNCTAPSKYANLIRVKKYLGTADQTADATLISESNGLWTSNHRLRGVAYIYVRLKYNQDSFPGGIPSISTIIKGKKLYDPRTSTTAFSNNPALVLRDYLTNSDYGLGATSDEIDDSSFITAANICDEDVALDGGGIEDRYTCSGIIDTQDSPKNNIEALLTAMGGTLYYSGGEWTIKAASYTAPTVTLTNDDLRGPVEVQTRHSRRDNFNAVKGVFTSPEMNWQPTDFPAVTSSVFEQVDGGQQTFMDMELPFTTSPATAQRLAKISLYRQRQQMAIRVSCNLKPMSITVGDNIQFDNDRLGFSGKVFEVVSWSFSSQPDNMGVDLDLKETSSEVYDWNAEEVALELDNTTLPDPFTVNAPSNLTVSADVQINADGRAEPVLDVSWDASTTANVTEYEFQYKSQAESAYKSYVVREPEFRLNGVISGTTYDIKVRAISILGARSAFIVTSGTATSDDTAPSAPTGLTAEAGFDSISLSWTNPSDSDLDIIEIYEGLTSVQANASLIATTKGSSFTRGGLSNGVTRHYWLKAVDYSGNKSAFNSPTGVSETTLIPVTADDIVGTIETVDALTTGLGSADIGKVEFLTTDQKIYRWSGTEWVTGVTIDDVTGDITANRISVASLSALSASMGTLTAGKLQNADSSFVVDLDNKTIYIQ